MPFGFRFFPFRVFRVFRGLEWFSIATGLHQTWAKLAPELRLIFLNGPIYFFEYHNVTQFALCRDCAIFLLLAQ